MAQDRVKQIPLIEVENMKKYYPIKGGIITHTTGFVKAWSVLRRGKYIMKAGIWPRAAQGR